MHLGVAIFFTDASISPAELAVESEQRGFESLWACEHSHIPVSRATPFPGGGDLPKMYYDVMDPFVTLAAAAAVTSTLKLGTGICLVVQRDPIQTAKSVASLDQVSQGRFLFGIGGGWNAEEMANHGTTDFRGRWKLMRERVESMKEIWTQEEASYHGEHVDFDPVYAWPKPVQSPHPPIHVGGAFPSAPRRALRYANGWIPIAAPGDSDVSRQMPEFRRMVEESGREADSVEVSVFACPPKESRVARYREAGLTRAVFMLPPAPRDEVLPILDRCAKFLS